MGENICNRCGIEFGRKDVLIKHLKKKNICMPIEMDEDRNIQLELLSKKCEIECDKCNKMYKNSNSLRMHKCKIIDKTEEILEALSELKNENKMMKEKLENMSNINSIKNITNTTNNTDNSNNTNNITIVLPNSFGKENLDYLLKNPEKEVIKLLRGCYPESIVNFVKEVHKNPEHPENHNIRVDNKKDGIISIFENEKWQDHTKTNGLKKIYNNTELKVLELIDESNEEVIKKYVKPKQIERFNKETELLEWSDVIDTQEEDVKLIYDRIEIIASKEQQIEEKKKDKEIERKRKEFDNLMLRAVSK